MEKVSRKVKKTIKVVRNENKLLKGDLEHMQSGVRIECDNAPTGEQINRAWRLGLCPPTGVANTGTTKDRLIDSLLTELEEINDALA